MSELRSLKNLKNGAPRGNCRVFFYLTCWNRSAVSLSLGFAAIHCLILSEELLRKFLFRTRETMLKPDTIPARSKILPNFVILSLDFPNIVLICITDYHQPIQAKWPLSYPPLSYSSSLCLRRTWLHNAS